MESLNTNLRIENLSDQVLAYIQKAIIRGELKPGDYLPAEKDLAEMLGVGKSSAREAVTMLKTIGIVESRQGKRSRICSSIGANAMTPLIFSLILQGNQSDKLYEFRMMFEKAYLAIAYEKATEEDRQAIVDELARYEALHLEGNATFEDDRKFHFLILQITRNPYIIKLGESLYEMFRVPMEQSNAYNSAAVLADHKKIVASFFTEDMVERDRMIAESLAVYQDVLHLKQEAK